MHVQGHRVAEWVKHAVGLPQYVQTFRDNSVTVRCVRTHAGAGPRQTQRALDPARVCPQVLDFPTLVNDGGATLEKDLGVRARGPGRAPRCAAAPGTARAAPPDQRRPCILCAHRVCHRVCSQCVHTLRCSVVRTEEGPLSGTRRSGERPRAARR